MAVDNRRPYGRPRRHPLPRARQMPPYIRIRQREHGKEQYGKRGQDYRERLHLFQCLQHRINSVGKLFCAQDTQMVVIIGHLVGIVVITPLVFVEHNQIEF